MTRRSALWGTTGAAVLTSFYIAVLAGSAGWGHLGDTLGRDWYLVLPLVLGFGLQITILVEVRRRHQAGHGLTAVAGAGTGTSAVGMVACCAHHLVDLVPLVGLSGTATFLTAQQRPLMWAAVALTAAGVLMAARQLPLAPSVIVPPRELTCAH